MLITPLHARPLHNPLFRHSGWDPESEKCPEKPDTIRWAGSGICRYDERDDFVRFRTADLGGASLFFRSVLILVSLIFLALFFPPSTARAADLVIPELGDVIMSLRVVSGRTVSQARDVTNDGKIGMSDALYSMQYVVRQIWADPATELAVGETLEEETLTPRDSAVSGISPADEDALARAIVAANEADLQSKILYNSFYMAAESTPAATLLNRYRAMMKSFEIAEGEV